MIFSGKTLLNLKFNLCTIPPSSSSFTGRFSERGRASGRARRAARGATSLILPNLVSLPGMFEAKGDEGEIREGETDEKKQGQEEEPSKKKRGLPLKLFKTGLLGIVLFFLITCEIA